MSSISGLGAYSSYNQYNWQSVSSSSALSTAQTALGSMSGSGMLGQISSMIELTRYAMEQMGISENGNVTFSQISKYRNELSQSFDTSLRSALSAVGVQNMSGLTFSLSSSGKITVQSSNAADQQTVQAYLDAHPELGQTLLKGISDEGVTLTGNINFRLGGNSFVVISPEAEDLTVALGDNTELSDELREGLTELGVNLADGLKLYFNEEGLLEVDAGTENADAVNAWLAEQTEITDELKTMISDAGASASNVILTLPASGSMTAETLSQGNSDLQDSLREALAGTDLGSTLRDGLKAQGLLGEGNLQFSFDADGNLIVDPETENAEAINAWLAEQTETAAALRDACKAQGVSENSVTFGLTSTGELQPTVAGEQSSDSKQLEAARAAFAKLGNEARALQEGLAELSIDPDAEFTIKLNSDGTVTIGGTHPDVEKIQQVFDDNPSLIKAYSQIEALSGLDQARAAMNISPSAMRRTLQMESIAAAWWSGNMSNSYFGTYSGQSGFNLLSGLNMSV